MPIKKTLRNSEFFAKSMFNTTGQPLDENQRDKSKDYIHKEVVRPDRSIPMDFETFEYYVEKLIETRKILNKEYSGIFGRDMINFISNVNEPFYTLRNIIFTDYDDEMISEFADQGYIEYWPENYFEDKYGKSNEDYGYIVKPEDYEDTIKVDTIQGLYEYLNFNQ